MACIATGSSFYFRKQFLLPEAVSISGSCLPWGVRYFLNVVSSVQSWDIISFPKCVKLILYLKNIWFFFLSISIYLPNVVIYFILKSNTCENRPTQRPWGVIFTHKISLMLILLKICLDKENVLFSRAFIQRISITVFVTPGCILNGNTGHKKEKLYKLTLCEKKERKSRGKCVSKYAILYYYVHLVFKSNSIL